MREAIQALLEAPDHARDAAEQFDAAIAELNNASLRPSTTDAALVATSAEERPVPPFWLGQPVALKLSSERGTVIGNSVFLRQPPQFLVEYLTGDGRQLQAWFESEALRSG